MPLRTMLTFNVEVMKLYRLFFIGVIALLPLLSGCPEKDRVTTKINADGSGIRSTGNINPKEYKGIDSITHDLLIPVDESWELQQENDSTALLVKEFESVEDLNKLFETDRSTMSIYDRKIEFEKQFRWFHTNIIYREIYGGLFQDIPLENYLSEAEIAYFKSGLGEEDPLMKHMNKDAMDLLDENIEMRLGLWIHDQLLHRGYRQVLEIMDSMNLRDELVLGVEPLEDSVVKYLDERDMRLMTFEDDQIHIVEFARIMGFIGGLDSASIEKIAMKVEQNQLDEEYENMILSDDYFNQLIMPGLLTDTNAEELKGDTLIWDVGSLKFLDADFVMFAESKVPNYWAYLVSGFVLIVALIIPFIRKKKA